MLTKLSAFCLRGALQIANKYIFFAISLRIVTGHFRVHIPIFCCVDRILSSVTWWILWRQCIRITKAFVRMTIFALLNVCLQLGKIRWIFYECNSPDNTLTCSWSGSCKWQLLNGQRTSFDPWWLRAQRKRWLARRAGLMQCEPSYGQFISFCSPGSTIPELILLDVLLLFRSDIFIVDKS